MRLVARLPERYPGLLESSAPLGAASGGGRFDILPISSGECLRLMADHQLSGPHAAGAAGFLDAFDAWWSSLRVPASDLDVTRLGSDGVSSDARAALSETEDAAPDTHGTPPGSADASHDARAAGPLPFSGGWLVYLGYELAGEIEPRLQLPPGTDPLVALAIRTPAAWVRDRAAGRAWLVAEAGYEKLLDDLAQDVRNLGVLGDDELNVQSVGATDGRRAPLPPATDTSPPQPPAATDARRVRSSVPGDVPADGSTRFTIHEDDPAQFLEAAARALDYIAAGDVYQVNLSRQWFAAAERVDPVSIYERLRAANPSPFAALLRHGDFSLMSSSPERLLSIRGDRVSTRPIAGTRPRGTSPEQDAALIKSLLDNDKERAEHVMLIDLERNDLGRVCVGGSVRVDEYMTVETYAHVHHIVSNVSGRLRAAVTPVAAIRALFPGGTITGCPKVRCMELIAELEGGGRGAYTGSIGYVNRDGSCDFNILIRTLTANGDTVTFRAGAGIVADSNAPQELAEARAKALGLLRALGVAN